MWKWEGKPWNEGLLNFLIELAINQGVSIGA